MNEDRLGERWRYWDRFRYRVGQFFAGFRKAPLPESELLPARAVLTERQMDLFLRLQPSEQAHSLRVLQNLMSKGEVHPDLLAAALLHDIGKICHPLRIWERVVVVLVKWMVPHCLEVWGQGDLRGWKRPFVISYKHPTWGADLVSKTAASELLLDLIREHEVLPTAEAEDRGKIQLLAALREADDWN